MFTDVNVLQMLKSGKLDLMFMLIKSADHTIKDLFTHSNKKHSVGDIGRNRASLYALGTEGLAYALTNVGSAGGLRRGFYGIESQKQFPTSYVYKQSEDAGVALERARQISEYLETHNNIDDSVDIFANLNFFDDLKDQGREYIHSCGDSDYLHDLEYYETSDDMYDKAYVYIPILCGFF